MGRFLRTRVLRALPGRIARYGDAAFRHATLRRLRKDAAPYVVLVTHDLSRSGAPMLVLEIARLLRARYLVVVLSPVTGPFLADLLDDGLDVIVDYRLATAGFVDLLGDRCAFAICNTVDTAPVAARLAARAPVLWYLHEVSLLDRRLTDPVVRAALAAVQRLWAGSPMCAERLLPLRPDVEVVPYGVAPLPPAAKSGHDATLTIGVFGSLERRKGQDLVVEAARGLPPAVTARVRVELFGRILEPDFARDVLAKAEGTIVDYRGELDRASYIAAMQNVDAVLVSSRDDTLPLVSLDALGLGKLLLLVPSVGTGAWLDDGVDTLVAKETSAPAIADLIVRAASIEDRAPFAAAARRAFDAHFAPAAFRERLDAAVAALAR